MWGSVAELKGNQEAMGHDAPEKRRPFVDPRRKARRYQLEVLDRALEENTIIFLETGCGKTLIAVLLIEALSHLIRKPSEKIAVFLVPNRSLVEQQAREIEEHTNLRIGKFWGSMGESYSSSYSWWQDQLVKYEVFVMTPQILFNILHHCFLRMEMIELLIFDECHHAQKRHPYANIMRDFYHEQKLCLPKIFGLTASPIIGKVDGGGLPQKIDSQIHKLENMLNARLYTLKDRMEVETLLPNPNQHLRKYQPSYDRDHVKQLSGLLQGLRRKYTCLSEFGASDCNSMKTKLVVDKKEMDEVSKVYQKLDYCIYELGLWCTIKAAKELLGKEKHCLAAESTGMRVKEAFLRDALSMLKAAGPKGKIDSCGAQDDDPIDLDEAWLSPKVLCLVEVLMENRVKYTKCIVFVDRVVATTAVSSLLNHLKCLPFIQSLPLVGSQAMSQKSQQQAIEKFRSDEVNLLVATEIAEEGLDIQSCFMVIRFDGAPKTTRSFIQSRGRARQQGSTYIVLLECGNQEQFNDVVQLKEKEKLMWEFTENRGDMPVLLEEPERFDVECFKVESTGAMVTTDYSIPLLYRYCAKLPGDEFYRPVPDFSYLYVPTGVVCEIRLPSTAPLRVVTGHSCQTAKMARRVAALEACRRLHEVGALTDRLLPASELEDMNMGGSEDRKKRNLPADPMAQMELHPSVIPDAFRGQWGGACAKACLFVYSLHIVAEPKDREYAEFALFLEADLDSNTKRTLVELYLTRRRTVKVGLVPCGQVEFDGDQLRDAKIFQERIFSIVLDPKTQQDSLQHLCLPTSTHWDPGCLYLTLPLAPSVGNPVAINWKCVHSVLMTVSGPPPLVSIIDEDKHTQEKPDVEGQSRTCSLFQMSDGPAPVDTVINSLVETIYNGRLYCVVDVLWEMDADSVFKHDPSQRSTYVDYYKNRYRLDLIHTKQKLLLAKPLMKMHNLLVRRPDPKEAGPALKAEMFVELIPELCRLRVFGIPTQIVNTVSLIPSFMHRLEYILLATQLQKQLEAAFSEAAKVSPQMVLQALTTAKCLESFSLERLELFGDSFLKFAVSKRLFLVHDKKDEGALTKMRENVICNSSLHQRGVAHKLTMYIHDELFVPLHWSAPGRPSPVHCDATNCAAIHALQDAADASNPNQVKCSEGHRWLQKKAVADVVEAFIGAHLVDGGPDVALAFMEWAGLHVYFDTNLIVEASARCAGDVRFIQGKDLKKLEIILGYTFQNKSILVEALTHPSYQVPFGNCYQRLEFLGDAVLDYLITSHLYATFPELPPGLLTDLRSATVSNECFARVAVRHHLQHFLLHENAHLAEQVDKFVVFMKDVSRGRDHFYGWECDNGPKVLGDLVESLAGAVLVDTAFDTTKVWSVFEPLLQPIVTPETLHLHPVRELVELCNVSKYDLEFRSPPDMARKLVSCTVMAGQKKFVAYAEKADFKSGKRLAAYKMLEILKDLGFEHRYQTLKRTLFSRGRLDPSAEASDVCSGLGTLDRLEIPDTQSSHQAEENNLQVSPTLDFPSWSAGNDLYRLTEKGVINSLEKSGSNSTEEGIKDYEELLLPSSSCATCEESARNLSEIVLDSVIQNEEKLDSPRCSFQSETSPCAHLSEAMEMDPSAVSMQNISLNSPRESGQEEASGMHLLSGSFKTMELSGEDINLYQNIPFGKEGSQRDPKAPDYEPYGYDRFIEDNSFPPGPLPEKQAPLQKSNVPLEPSFLHHDVWEDKSMDSTEVSSDVQILIDALVNHPALQQLCHVNGSPEPLQTGLEEDICNREVKTWGPELASLNPDHTMPSTFCTERSPGSFVDENVGRPRDDLYNLCAKYKWRMPNYKPCPDYPQGPPHAPRFAYVVNLSCSLTNRGQTCEYEIECEGHPMKDKKRAMDSAASCALRWLTDSSDSGLSWAQTHYCP